MRELLEHADAFVFDLDGTLADTEPQHVNAFRRAMRTLVDYELTASDEREYNGNTCNALAKTLSQRHALDLDPNEVAALKFEILYRDFQTDFFTGAIDFLRTWAPFRRLAIASNSPLHFVQRCLRDGGVLELFDVIVTVSDVRRRKPDPEMILLAAERLGLPPDRTLVFEDSEPGMQAALNAKSPVALLDNPGYHLPTRRPLTVPVTTWGALGTIAAGKTASS